MSALLVIILALFGFVGVLVMAGIVLHRKSYKYRCMVGIQSGDDVIWMQDNFKVRRRGNHDEIMFLRHKGKVYSPPYGFWSKWFVGNQFPDDTQSNWHKITGDLRKAIISGAHFFRVSEDEYKVARLNPKTGEFDVLDNDSKELYMDDLERTYKLTRKTSDVIIQALVWIGSIVIICAFAIVIFILTTNYAAEQSAQIVGLAQRAIAEQAAVGA